MLRIRGPKSIFQSRAHGPRPAALGPHPQSQAASACRFFFEIETPIEVERLETTPYGSLRKPCTCFLWGPRICVFFVTSMGSPYVKRCLPHHGQRHSRRCFLAKVWKVFAILQATWELRSNEHDCCIGFSLDPPVLVPMAHVGNVRPGGGRYAFEIRMF